MLFIGTEPPLRSGLPRSEDFSKAIYTIDIGQNDIGYGLQKPNSSEEEVRRSIPDILSQFSQAVQVIISNHQRNLSLVDALLSSLAIGLIPVTL